MPNPNINKNVLKSSIKNNILTKNDVIRTIRMQNLINFLNPDYDIVMKKYSDVSQSLRNGSAPPKVQS